MLVAVGVDAEKLPARLSVAIGTAPATCAGTDDLSRGDRISVDAGGHGALEHLDHLVGDLREANEVRLPFSSGYCGGLDQLIFFSFPQTT